jgi:hypothetical protein
MVRSEDVFLISGTDFSTFIGDGTDWVAVFEFTAPAYLGLLCEMAGAADRGGANGVFDIDLTGGSALVNFWGSGFSAQGSLALGSLPSAGSTVKIAVGYAANKMQASMNGGATQQDLSGAITGTLGRLRMGASVPGTRYQPLAAKSVRVAIGLGSTITGSALQALSAL